MKYRKRKVGARNREREIHGERSREKDEGEGGERLTKGNRKIQKEGNG